MRRFGAAALAVVMSLTMSAPAAADISSDLTRIERRIAELERAIEEAEGERTEYANRVLETAAAFEAVRAELQEAEDALAGTEQQIAATERTLAELVERMGRRQALVAQLRATADAERQAVLERAVELYMAAHADVTLPFVGSTDPGAGIGLVYADRVQNLADGVIAEYELHRHREQQEVDRLAGERVEAEAHRAVLAEQQAERAAAAAEVAARAAVVAEQLAAQQALLDEIDYEISHFEGEITSLEREEAGIRAVIAAEQTSAGTAPGILLRPVPGAVSSGYGYRIHPIYGGQRLHTGWDMNGGCGDPIRAASSGRVFFTGWKGGYGNAVMIDHGGGLSTLYAHQSAIGVSYGQQVTAGEVIGWVGTTGTSTACHLHWEVRVSGNPVDPTPYV